MRILFCGPNASELAQATHHGDVAAARWSYSLLRALADKGHQIVALTHTHERIWPRGEKLWRSRDERYFPTDWPCVDVPYPAIYKLRENWLNCAYPRKARKLLKEQKFDAMLLYNCMEPYQVAVMHEANRAGLPVFPIILDGDDPRRDNWEKLKHDTAESTGVVFLSHWAKENYPLCKPTLHLDGGAERWMGRESECWHERKEKIFVHTGALDYWRGLDLMKQVARIVDQRNLPVRFVLCGRILPDMKNAFKDCRCVTCKGFLSDDDLDSLCRSADGFLNVREPSVGDNILNYPSKLPRCMSYGKPIVSTWVDSFSSDYRDLLWANETNTPEGFVRELERVSQASQAEILRKYSLTKAWFESSRLWSSQAESLIRWIEGVV